MRHIIEDSPYTQTEVANRLGVSQPRFNQYLSEKREPDIEFILKFCKFFNITPNKLFGYEEYSKLEDKINISEENLRNIVYTAYKVFDEYISRQKPKEDIEKTAQKIADVCVNAAQVETTDRIGQLKGMVLSLFVKKTG